MEIALGGAAAVASITRDAAGATAAGTGTALTDAPHGTGTARTDTSGSETARTRRAAGAGGPEPGAMVLLTRLARRVYRTATEDVLGMNLRAFILLNQLCTDDGMPQHEVGELMGLAPNNLVLLLNDMERAGWIERRRDAADRRRHLVHRTAAGLRALKRAERGMDGVEDRVLGSLSTEDRDALRALLAKALDGAQT